MSYLPDLCSRTSHQPRPFPKVYKLLLKEWKELEIRLPLKKEQAVHPTHMHNIEFVQYVQKLREAISHEKAAEQLPAEI